MRTTSRQLDTAARVRRAATALAARTRVERLGELSLNQVAVLGRIVTHGPLTPGEVAAQLRDAAAVAHPDLRGARGVPATSGARRIPATAGRRCSKRRQRAAPPSATRCGRGTAGWRGAMARAADPRRGRPARTGGRADGAAGRARRGRRGGRSDDGDASPRPSCPRSRATVSPLRRIAGLFAPYRWQVAASGRRRRGAGAGERRVAVPHARDHRPGACPSAARRWSAGSPAACSSPRPSRRASA